MVLIWGMVSYDEAVAVCRQACQFSKSGFMPLQNLAAALAEARQIFEAWAPVEKATERQPVFSIGFLRDGFPACMKPI